MRLTQQSYVPKTQPDTGPHFPLIGECGSRAMKRALVFATLFSCFLLFNVVVAPVGEPFSFVCFSLFLPFRFYFNFLKFLVGWRVE